MGLHSGNVECGCQFGAFPLSCSSFLVSPSKELIHSSEASSFVTATQGIHSGDLASRAYACSPIGLYIFAYLKNIFNVYFWETERDRAQVGEGQRERHRTWSRLQALSCQHRTWQSARTCEPRDRDLSRSQSLNRLSHPGTPAIAIFLFDYLGFLPMSLFYIIPQTSLFFFSD